MGAIEGTYGKMTNSMNKISDMGRDHGAGVVPAHFDFDEMICRIGTHSEKWDCMEAAHGISPSLGIPMWVADMDFRPPEAVQRAVEALAGHGVYGYFGDEADYLASIRWWMHNRHGWLIEDDWVFTTHGLVNGAALCVDAFSEPGDGVVLMTPVYHAFARVIRAAGREVTECRLSTRNGRYEMDFDTWDRQMTGREKMLVLCSPHNPGGRVWSQEELLQTVDFCNRHNLILVSDEIHHDLVFPGNCHTVLAKVAPEALHRMVIMTAATKTFNIAGAHIGNVIIPDANLRARFAGRIKALGISSNAFGMHMVTAAYSQHGAVWLEALLSYLDGNRRLFDEGINALPGVTSMPLEATYLAWVDFAGTGLNRDAFTARVKDTAKIAVNYGLSFGGGGETYLRFNFATQRKNVHAAVERLHAAFSGLHLTGS